MKRTSNGALLPQTIRRRLRAAMWLAIEHTIDIHRESNGKFLQHSIAEKKKAVAEFERLLRLALPDAPKKKRSRK